MSVDLCCPNCGCFIHTVHSENNYKEPNHVKSCPNCGDGRFPWKPILQIGSLLLLSIAIGVLMDCA